MLIMTPFHLSTCLEYIDRMMPNDLPKIEGGKVPDLSTECAYAIQSNLCHTEQYACAGCTNFQQKLCI